VIATEIRAAGPADADAIAALHADSWRRSYQRVWLVDGDPVAGFVCLFGDGDPVLGAYVDNLHVDRDVQGRGVGAALLRHAAGWTLAERPGSGLYLWAFAANVRARGFYRHLGAVEDAREEFGDPGGGSGPSVRCVWPDPALLAA
jgi:GNAT superfamily N-acetyltransferase